MVLTNPGRNFRRGLGFIIIAFSAYLLIWSVRPAEIRTRRVAFPEDAFRFGENNPGKTLEASQFQVAWPVEIPTGKTGEIFALLEPVDQPVNDSAQSQAIEARLEIPGISIAPGGTIQQALQAADPIEFHWQVQPARSGVYQGILWLHLVDVASPAGNFERRSLLSAQLVEVTAVSLLGMNAYLAQVIGIIGIISGTVLCLDVFIYIFRRLFRTP